MAFAEKISKEIDMFEWEREYYQWLRLPPWQKYEADLINGLDDGEEPTETPQPTQEELETMVGHKLIDLDKLGIPY